MGRKRLKLLREDFFEAEDADPAEEVKAGQKYDVRLFYPTKNSPHVLFECFPVVRRLGVCSLLLSYMLHIAAA